MPLASIDPSLAIGFYCRTLGMSYAIIVGTSQLQVYRVYKLTPLVTCSSIPENSAFADFADSTGD